MCVGRLSWLTAGKVFAEADINNCFVNLLMIELSQVCNVAEDMPTLSAFAANYKAWRSFLAAYMGVSAKEAKKLLIKILHLGTPPCDLPFLWNLAVDMHKAVGMLLALEKFSYLEGRFANRRCPPASKLHYALSSLEDTILSDLEKEVTSVNGVSMNTYMFDGAVFLTREDAMDELRAAVKTVADKWGVTMSVVVIGEGDA